MQDPDAGLGEARTKYFFLDQCAYQALLDCAGGFTVGRYRLQVRDVQVPVEVDFIDATEGFALGDMDTEPVAG